MEPTHAPERPAPRPSNVLPDREEAERIVLPPDSPAHEVTGDIRLYLASGYALLKLSRLSGSRSRPRACVRSVGPPVGAERVVLRDRDGRVVARSPRIPKGPGAERCAELALLHGKLEAGRYTLRARARDSFGHPLSARRPVHLG